MQNRTGFEILAILKLETSRRFDLRRSVQSREALNKRRVLFLYLGQPLFKFRPAHCANSSLPNEQSSREKLGRKEGSVKMISLICGTSSLASLFSERCSAESEFRLRSHCQMLPRLERAAVFRQPRRTHSIRLNFGLIQISSSKPVYLRENFSLSLPKIFKFEYIITYCSLSTALCIS